MNYKILFNTLGKVMLFLALFMCVPMLVGIGYGEYDTVWAFVVPILALGGIGLALSLMKVKNKEIYAREGFVIVALSWVIMSLFGAIPFVISGVIPNYIDAFFETVSGFTTTGASIMTLGETLTYPMGIMFWRSFTHWLGGMGVLVLVLALIPSDGAMHIYRAESPGPSASKLVSKMRFTARILYGIYIALTLIMTIMLLCGGMNLYESLLTAFSTAGTGGFSVYGTSIMHYNNVYFEMVIASFMLLFGINFNVYYLILIGKVGKAIKSEELWVYIGIVFVAIITIAINIVTQVGNFWTALRYSFFQTAAFSSTTGFVGVNFDNWPALSKSILLFLTIMGACGGSTGGGIKVSRLIILAKSGVKDVKKSLHPRSVNVLKFENEIIPREVERNTRTYFIIWVAIAVVSTLLLSFDSFDAVAIAGTNMAGEGLWTHFSATLTALGNVGPALTKALGATGSFAGYSWFSKLVLSFDMLAGRLEIFPIILLLAPRTWRRS